MTTTMTTTTKKSPKWIIVFGILMLIPVLFFGGFGAYGLYQTDKLPWQTQPTRIPITPVEMPSFGTIGDTSAGTPAPTTVVTSTPAS
ncbi:MAG TPA: hypothetical protein VFP05_03255 [Thermomicrobiales bacterium]|nr:hypothetical protein [Thermomicrobiales bacterium]